MRPETGWNTAFLRQAEADYRLFIRLLNDPAAAQCHIVHALQMATEKLAKALLASDQQPPPRMHTAFTNFVRFCGADVRLMRRLKMRSGAYRAFVRSLLPIALEIERLAPSGAGLNQPNAEYPWATADAVIAPVDHRFDSFHRNNPIWLKMARFLECVFDRYLQAE